MKMNKQSILALTKDKLEELKGWVEEARLLGAKARLTEAFRKFFDDNPTRSEIKVSVYYNAEDDGAFVLPVINTYNDKDEEIDIPLEDEGDIFLVFAPEPADVRRVEYILMTDFDTIDDYVISEE